MRAACLSVDRYLDGFEQGCPGVLPDSDTHQGGWGASLPGWAAGIILVNADHD